MRTLIDDMSDLSHRVKMACRSDSLPITFQQLKTIASSLENVVAVFFGPQCSHTLMTSSTGKAVVTSDGYTILQSINASHPLAAMITKAIECCHSYTYDGCKTFIIYLSRFLLLLEIEISKGTFITEGTSRHGNRRINEYQAALCISRCLKTIRDEILPNVFVEVVNYCSNKYNHFRNLTETFKFVVKTTLMPHFNPKLCDFLTEILVGVISSTDDVECMKESIEFLLQNFGNMCIRIPEQPYDRTQVVNSYIIQREFTLISDGVESNKELNVIWIKTTLFRTKDSDEPNETFKVKGSSQISDSLIGKVRTVTKFAEQCLKLGINAIISTEGVPQFALDILRARGISVVHYVLKEDVAVLERFTDTLAVADIDDLSESNIVRAKQIIPISICGHKCVQIQICSKIKVKNLILCAPTVGLCDQLYLLLQKAVKALHLCLKKEDLPLDFTANLKLDSLAVSDLIRGKEDSEIDASIIGDSKKDSAIEHTENLQNNDDEVNKILQVIPGGGGFEILLSNILRKHAANLNDVNTEHVCSVLSDALIEIIRILHKNTSESGSGTHATASVVEYLQRKYCEGLLLGLNRRGIPTDLSETGVLEPLLLKMHTLNCVLSLLEQLLKIDQIVSVKEK